MVDTSPVLLLVLPLLLLLDDERSHDDGRNNCKLPPANATTITQSTYTNHQHDLHHLRHHHFDYPPITFETQGPLQAEATEWLAPIHEARLRHDVKLPLTAAVVQLLNLSS